MQINHLFLENFLCHQFSFIDFTQFTSALIIGKANNNDLYSNGVGKSSIFRAIEYVLFNQSDIHLEKIIRDDTDMCKIIMDFTVADQEYRLIRARTKKASKDFSLFVRTAQPADKDTYYLINNNNHIANTIDKFWKDISGRRAEDTERDLAKLININFRSFRGTVHFMQNDFSGLATATPEKKKAILKDGLNLAIYSKLEKLAKEQAADLAKEIEKKKNNYEYFGDPAQDIVILNQQLTEQNHVLSCKKEVLIQFSLQQDHHNEQLLLLKQQCSILENQSATYINQHKTLLEQRAALQTSINEYNNKKTNIITLSKNLVSQVSDLRLQQIGLSKMEPSMLEILQNKLLFHQEKITQNHTNIINLKNQEEELSIPLPKDGSCKHCRQLMSEEHRQICQKKIESELMQCKAQQQSLISENGELKQQIEQYQTEINAFLKDKEKLQNINQSLKLKDEEIQAKKALYDEYNSLLEKFKTELLDKDILIETAKKQINASSITEIKELQIKINTLQQESDAVNKIKLSHQDEINKLDNSRAVIENNIEKKKEDIVKKEQIKTDMSILEEQYLVYPSILQAFSSSGIPNLIIQNVLNDLQQESNILLSQLRPGLQLSFIIEKTKTDGTETDTLDIEYCINGKQRSYEQLSGAMKLAVAFSLKLGFSFLLQKMMGTNIKFLLLDEIDQSLDKASVDAFAEIIKFFEKEFTILIITHNDRLKEKFAHTILVEQDIGGVSRTQTLVNYNA